ncbi:MAG TPA: Gfo/Idh/MocA family oxidoreductase [Acidobacteriaceae bacterium]|nr:Gfo/Idh/MocA family oxidoreductase [Acidobacteriaceae bacterium]
MKSLGVGLVGAGFMGRTNAETVKRYTRGAHLVAITGGSRAAALATEYGMATEPGTEALFARPDVDVVMISTPHAAHAEQAVAAARAGKHILLDKPMATTLEDCDRILEAVRSAGVRLMIMFGQRFRDCNIEAHRLVRAGAIGRVRMMQEQILATGGLASLPGWQSLPENIGILIGHAVHNIDRIRWISGSEIVSVSAQVQRDPATNTDVSSMVLLGLASGAIATLWASWNVASPAFPHTASRSVIAGETGNLDCDAYGELRLGQGKEWKVVTVQAPIDWAGQGALSPVRMEAYRRQHQEFLDAVCEDREPLVTGEDGRAAVQVALAAYRSAAEGRVIQLA